ncbi:MAG: rhombosortase [Opitutae bacterium]|nr:rhombosortase [Opitutae bacterium]
MSEPAQGRPWVTAALAVATVLVAASPAMQTGLMLDRPLISVGQVWRLWTGHLVHHGASHGLWNLVVFIPVGCWLERIRPTLARLYLLIASALISAGLLAFDPQLSRYAGLSGLATGLLLLLACDRLKQINREPRWVWLGVLILVAGKIGFEWMTDTPIFSRLNDGVKNVPLAHLFGAVSAVGFFLLAQLKTFASADRPIA